MPVLKDTQGGAIASFFVRRPVLALVLSILIVLGGIAALLGIEVRELPNVDQPVLSIDTDYTGASADTVDNQVTSIIEGAVARVQGVSSISSTSRQSRSSVDMSFVEGTDLETAISDVRSALSRVADQLPATVIPTVVKGDPNAQPIVQLSVTSNTVSRDDLTALVDNTIAPRFTAVPGVADVQIYGEQAKAFLVDVDQSKLASVGLTVADLKAALSSAAFDTPTGTLAGGNEVIPIRATGPVATPAAFEDVILKPRVHLGDVARVILGPQSGQSSLRADGSFGIGLSIIRSAKSNTIQISSDVRAAANELQQELPPGVIIRASSDDSVFITGAVQEVARSLAIAVAAVIAIIFLFLLDWRATLIPALSIPVALIGTVAGIYLAGFSINILTLLALVLATGLVVDDAIVVLENITRHRGMGLGKGAAAVLGTQEVFFAVVATTATLVAVFVPLSFLPAQTGRLFREFGFTLAIAVALSAVVALSLTPMLASRLLSKPLAEGGAGGFTSWSRRLGDGLARLFRSCLRLSLDFSLIVVLLAAVVAAVAYFEFGSLRQELTPSEDRASINLNISAPPTASLDFTQTQLLDIETLLQPLRDRGDIQSVFSISGLGGTSSRGRMTLTLAPWDQRANSQAEIIGEVKTLLQQVPAVKVSIPTPNSLGIRGGGGGLQFAIVGNDYASLASDAQRLAAEMSNDPQFGDVTVNYDTSQPQVTITVDTTKANTLGIAVDGLAQTLSAMVNGTPVTNVFVSGNSYPVVMISTLHPANDPQDLENIYVKTAAGRYLPLSSVAVVKEGAIPPSLEREQHRRAVSVSASLSDQLALGDAYARVQALAKPVLAGDAAIIPLAEAQTIADNNSGLLTTFGFAVVVVLLVLAAQFEGLFSALVVMTTVPFGLACAVFAIKFGGGTLNIYSEIGLILVVGVMAKNGILIVEFANQLRDRGLALRDAIEEATIIRLRPVLMTMIATVVGGVPLLLARGAGAEARHALGLVIVGGLGMAAVSTLLLTPVAYLLLARFSKPKALAAANLDRELAEAPTQVPTSSKRSESGS